jgi:hypothetical protein
MTEPTWLMNDFDFENHMGIGIRTAEKILRAERAARLAAEKRAEKAEKERETILAEALEWREKFERMKDTAAAEAEAFEDQKHCATTAIAERDAARAEVARYEAILNRRKEPGFMADWSHE